MFKAVMFDMDGLVIDTEQYYKECWIQAAKEFGFTMSEEVALKLRSAARNHAIPLLREEFGEAFDYDTVRDRRRELVEEAVRTRGIEKMPFVDELLRFLKDRGIKSYIVTATDEDRASRFLDMAGLRCSFDKITCATMVKLGKPEPDVYLYACERAGLMPSDCLALEDSPNGVMAAYRAGMNVIMVSALPEGEEIEKYCLKKVTDLGQVTEYIRLVN